MNDRAVSSALTAVAGPGVWDIHSPRVPGKQEIEERVAAMAKVLPKDLIWINPDCGLKTRGWKETEGARFAVFRALTS